jgi:hypothetical protein
MNKKGHRRSKARFVKDLGESGKFDRENEKQ